MAPYKKKEVSEALEEAQGKGSEMRQEEPVANAFGQATGPAARQELQLERVEAELADAEREVGRLGRLSNDIAEDLGLPKLAHKFWRVGAEFKVIREKLGMRLELGGLVAEREDRARAEVGKPPKTRGRRLAEKASGLKERMADKARAMKGALRGIAKNPRAYRPIPYMVKTARGVRDTVKGILTSRKEFKEVMGAMTPEYVGKKTHKRVSRDPIVMVRADGKYFELKARVKKERALKKEGSTKAPGNVGRIRGLSRSKTNNIVVNKEIREKAERMKTISHEAHHAVSWRGGSHLVGVGRKKPYILWFHEGLTELHAQQQVRSLGYKPKAVSYKAETAVSLFVQKIAGADELRKAYFSGHFDKVAARVDAVLGKKGAFWEILSAEKGRNALKLINGRVKSLAKKNKPDGYAALAKEELASLNKDALLRKTGFRFG
jgi:hypothetical protein